METMLKMLVVVAVALCSCKVEKDAKPWTSPRAIEAKSAKAGSGSLRVLALLIRDARAATQGPAKIEGAMSNEEYLQSPLLDEIEGKWDKKKIGDRTHACKLALFNRLGTSIDKSETWMMALRFVGDGHQVRLAEVRMVEAQWPAVFDEEARNCYMHALEDVSFDSKAVFDQVVEIAFCAMPEKEAGGK